MSLFARIHKSLIKKAEDEDWKKYEEICKFIFDNMEYTTFDCYVSKEIPQTLESPRESAEAVCEADGEIDLKTVEDKFGKLNLNFLNDQGGVAWQEASGLMKDLTSKTDSGHIFDPTTINYNFKINGDKLNLHVDAEPNKIWYQDTQDQDDAGQETETFEDLEL